MRVLAAPPPHFDLRRVRDATKAVLILRVLLGVWALFVSSQYPNTPLEKQIPVSPLPMFSGEVAPSLWMQRVAVEPWMRYDSKYYARIAQSGYSVSDGTASFHPLYPLSSRLISWPLRWLLPTPGAVAWALLLTSTLATIALTVLFTRYVARFHAEHLAQITGWLLLYGPLGWLLLAPYTESTFMALCVASLWMARENRMAQSGWWGALATLTRQQGIALLPVLCWQSWQNRREIPWWKSLVPTMLIPAGYAIYIFYRVAVLHDGPRVGFMQNPLEWLRGILVSSASQVVVPHQRLAPPWEPLRDQLYLIATTTGSYHLVIDLVLGWAMILSLLLGLKYLHGSERIFSVAMILLSACYYNGVENPYLSLPRHMLIALPLFIVWARWIRGNGTESSARQRRALSIAFVLNLFFCGAFVRHGWVP